MGCTFDDEGGRADVEVVGSVSGSDGADAEISGAGTEATVLCCCACEGSEPGGDCTADDGELEWPERGSNGGNQRVEVDEGGESDEEEESFL